MIAAATPPRLPDVSPTVRKKSMPNRSPVMYLWIASTRKVATAAFAIPDMASCPFGIFRLKSEKPASATKSKPIPDKIVIIFESSVFCLLFEYIWSFIDEININAGFQKVSNGVKRNNKKRSIRIIL